MTDLIERNAVLEKIETLRKAYMLHEPAGMGGMSAICHCRDIVKDIPSVNRWISCSERLPNEAGEYLVCGRWSGEKSKTWICQFKIFVDIGGFVNSDKNPPVSFWMPIPDAYKPPEKE